jgi:hypothetical protein
MVTGALFGGADVIQMPRYFRPWSEGLPQLRKQLKPIDGMKYFTRVEKARLKSAMAAAGLATGEANTMVMWGGSRRVLAVFDPRTLRIRALLAPD